MNILIINGPNINLLGTREPDIYGHNTYQDLIDLINRKSQAAHFNYEIKQSNHEGTIIDWLQDTLNQNFDAIIINPGAFTHYSYAILDAIRSIKTPTIEVHLTDIALREPYRNISVISEACITTFKGEHFQSYINAIDFILRGNIYG